MRMLSNLNLCCARPPPLLNSAAWNLTRLGSPTVPIIECLQQPCEMGHRCANNQHVEDLMRTPHDIESPGHETFGYSSRIDPCTKDIQEALKKKPTESNLLSHASKAKKEDAMDHGKDGRQAHPDKHGSAKWTPGGRAESGKDGNDHTAQSNGTDHGPIPVLELGDTVEPVEHAGYKAPNNKSHDPNVVKRITNAGNHWRMIRDSVVGGRHTKAEASPGEEATKGEDIGIGCIPVPRSK